MESGGIIGISMTVAGIVIMSGSFWFLAVKRLTAEFAVSWEIIGILLVVTGAVFAGANRTVDLYGLAIWYIIGIGAAGMLFCYLFCLLISRLMVKNHELAIEVSMLLQERAGAGCGTEKDLLIIMPVRNEEKNVGKVLERLSQPEIQEIADILCINDASSDTSGQIIDRYPCTQIRNVFRLGYGSALQLGYRYAVRKNYKYIIQMDADGQHDVYNVPLIYQKLQERGEDEEMPDIVLASRFMKGSSEFRVSAVKKFAFWLFRLMIRMVTGRKIADPTTGLQGLSRQAFSYYAHYNHFDYQYPDANMIMQMLLLQFRVTEIPAIMHMRTDGKSMHSGLEPVWYMLRMFLSVLAIVFSIKVLKNVSFVRQKDLSVCKADERS